MKRMSGIYRIVCKANGRYYYGSASVIGNRWSTHKTKLRHNKHENPVMQNSWNKHGESSFSIEIVELVEPEKLLEVEDKYLAEYFGNPNCMNINKLASAAFKGRHHSNEARTKMQRRYSGSGNPFFGKHHSNETKEKLRKANIGKKMSAEARRKISEAFTGDRHPMWGKTHTEEAKQKIRESNYRRNPYGETNFNAKYTWNLVKLLREEYATGNVTYDKLCKKYSIPKSSLAHILSGESWKETE